jgi:hypothetical protein
MSARSFNTFLNRTATVFGANQSFAEFEHQVSIGRGTAAFRCHRPEPCRTRVECAERPMPGASASSMSGADNPGVRAIQDQSGRLALVRYFLWPWRGISVRRCEPTYEVSPRSSGWPGADKDAPPIVLCRQAQPVVAQLEARSRICEDLSCNFFASSVPLAQTQVNNDSHLAIFF